MATGTNIVAGKSTTSEDTTELVADAVGSAIDFRGGVILKVGPQAGALSPHHDVTGIESTGANGGDGVGGDHALADASAGSDRAVGSGRGEPDAQCGEREGLQRDARVDD